MGGAIAAGKRAKSVKPHREKRPVQTLKHMRSENSESTCGGTTGKPRVHCEAIRQGATSCDKVDNQMW